MTSIPTQLALRGRKWCWDLNRVRSDADAATSDAPRPAGCLPPSIPRVQPPPPSSIRPQFWLAPGELSAVIPDRTPSALPACRYFAVMPGAYVPFSPLCSAYMCRILCSVCMCHFNQYARYVCASSARLSGYMFLI